MSGFKDLTGKFFGDGKLEVLCRDDSIPKGSKKGVFWLCKCFCGNIVSIPAIRLKTGDNVTCGKHRSEIRWTGHGEISGTYWLAIKHRCLQKEREFSITIEEAWELFLKQDRRCALTGRPLKFIRNYSSTSRAQTASLDRKNSDIGYRLDNCCWIDKTVNKMKHTIHSDYFIQTCQEIVDYQRKLRDEA